ncbi:MAG: terpene cyclase/mutase family protein [bacterium]|nr:terpene cyclase/mutase family protein [bacterium]
MKKQNKKKITILLILAVLLVIAIGITSSRRRKSPENIVKINDMMEDVVNWKKESLGVTRSNPLITEEYAKQAGTSSGDWFVFCLARMGVEDQYDIYKEALLQNIKERYVTTGGLDENKATEWHRIGLTLQALGIDPSNVMVGERLFDLVSDGTYNRGNTNELDAQGINGYIWALILLDSKDYNVPQDAYETRDDMIAKILTYQQKNGAFALVPGQESADITAMALTALAPYQKKEEVKIAVDKALTYLSGIQTDNGTFIDQNTESSETVSQVIVALTALGIDLQQDQRFIKNGNTVIDGLVTFLNPDGGFSHTNENDESNAIASEQALYALIAYDRFVNEESPLYQFQ